jgi:hypothetical protein
MAKASFTQSGPVVIAKYEAWTGDLVAREFFARGSYVYESTGRGERQVCARLSTRGETLRASEPLIEIIRSEYRAMRRDEDRRKA